MAKNVGNVSASSDPQMMTEINTTPLIDVMLVLLVMLIVTIPVQLHSVNLEMPVGIASANQIKPEKVQIDIDENSVVYWQGAPVNPQELDGKMQDLSRQALQPELQIRPNKNSSYAVFVNVLSGSKRLGLTKVAVIGAEQFVQ
jgi:biopolymer transport protein ExbD